MTDSNRVGASAGLRFLALAACVLVLSFVPVRAFATPTYEMTDGYGNVIDGTQVSIEALNSGLIISMTFDTNEANGVWRGYPTLIDVETGMAASVEVASDMGFRQVGSELNNAGFPRYQKWSVLYRVSGLIPGRSYQMTLETSQGINQPEFHYTYSASFSTIGSADDGGSGDQSGSGTGESTDPMPDAPPDGDGQDGGQESGSGGDESQGTGGTDADQGTGGADNGGQKDAGGLSAGQNGLDNAGDTSAKFTSRNVEKLASAQNDSSSTDVTLADTLNSVEDGALTAANATSESVSTADADAEASADDHSSMRGLSASSLMSMGQLYKLAGGEAGDAGGGMGDVDSSSTTADVSGIAWLWILLWAGVILSGPLGAVARIARARYGLAAASRLRMG